MDTRIALRVGDLFNAQVAEATYQRLVDFLNQQALETQRLRDLEATQSAKDALAAMLLDEKLAKVDTRVLQLESSAALQLECNRRVEERVMRLEKAAMGGARERKEIRAEVARVEQTTTKMLFQVHIGLSAILSLQVDQQLLHERLSTIDRRLEAKMEKVLLSTCISRLSRHLMLTEMWHASQSEASRVSALVTKINAFAPKSDQLSEKLDALEKKQAQMLKTLDFSDERWTSHQQELSRAEKRVKATEAKVDAIELFLSESAATQLSEQRERIQRLDETTGELTTKASTNEAAQRTLSAKFHSVAAVFAERLKQQSEVFQSMIAERARSADVLERFAEIRSDLSEKSHSTDLQNLAEEVESITIQCGVLEKHVQLSSRFVDWFATRDEAYEHNLDVVETQLGRIAYNSRPEIREPFGGQVRYPHR